MFYVVAKGKIPGIYDNWNDCSLQVTKFKGAIFKKFIQEIEAIHFFKQHNQLDKIQFFYERKNSDCNDDKLIKKQKSKIDNNVDYFVYTDGACINNGLPGAKAGIGIYISDDNPNNVSRRITGKQTNNCAELIAIIDTYQLIKNDLKLGKKITIVTDSAYSLKCIGYYGKQQEDSNWINDIPNINLVKKIYKLYQNEKNVSFLHINSHTGKQDKHSLGNDKADKLAYNSLTQ